MKPSNEPSEPFVADMDVYRLQDHTKANNGKQAVIRRIAIIKASVTPNITVHAKHHHKSARHLKW